MKNLEKAIKVFEFEAESLPAEKRINFICEAMNSYQRYIQRAELAGRELPEWNYIAECAINDVKSRIKTDEELKQARIETAQAAVFYNNID